MKKSAVVTFIRNGETKVETVTGFWKITWSPNHIVFHTNELDENIFIAYRAADVIEVYSEESED